MYHLYSQIYFWSFSQWYGLRKGHLQTEFFGALRFPILGGNEGQSDHWGMPVLHQSSPAFNFLFFYFWFLNRRFHLKIYFLLKQTSKAWSQAISKTQFKN